MKKITLTFCFLLTVQFVFAQATTSNIMAVTVFRQNAQITRKAQVKLQAGKQEIVLSGLSLYVNPASLQVKIQQEGVTLLSAKYLTNYLKSKVESAEIGTLRAQLEGFAAELGWIEDQAAILKNMEEVLLKNQTLGSRNTGFTAAEVIALVQAQKAKFLEIKKEKRLLGKKSKAISLNRNKIKKQLHELNAVSNQPTGDIVLSIQADRAVQVDFYCTYVVSQAGWNPLYDLRSEGITKNVQLFYKANVYQRTGQNWDNVAVTISNGNPTLNNNRPILSPLFARFYVAHAVSDNGRNKKIMAPQLMQESNMMEEIKDGYSYSATQHSNQITVEYTLPARHIILSDGKENLLALKTYELDSEYIYHSVPKIDKGAFLLAKISNWGQFNLESGDANIFFEGAFIGNTFINTDVTSDELLVSMGRDNGIVVTRKQIKDFAERKLLGSKQKETYAYNIVVKNKKTIPIHIEILDQLPVSTDKKIDIELIEKGSAVYTAENGKLLWTMKIPAGQSKKERFIYSVKYPKGQPVTGVR